jgi:hypothetical protein
MPDAPHAPMTDAPVALIRAAPADLPAFKRALQAAFALAVADQPGALDEGPIPGQRPRHRDGRSRSDHAAHRAGW